MKFSGRTLLPALGMGGVLLAQNVTQGWGTLPHGFRSPNLAPVHLANSQRLEKLTRDGKLYLSLQDAIALALEDNLDVLNATDDEAGDWGRAATRDLIRSRIKVKSLNFMRGRTFLNKFLIIDEAQNLTPKQMKTLITRAGPGTKVAIIGSGLAGMTVAYELGKRGYICTVLEARNRSGGRVQTIRRGSRQSADARQFARGAVRP